MLRVSLFGAGQASYAARPLAGFPNQQRFRLFCYLLLNRDHPQSRERLAALFWSDYSTATSRTYLRHTLWRLRQALQSVDSCADEYLSITDDTVAFVSTGSFDLDIERFEVAVARHLDIPEDQLSAEQVTQLEAATDLYTGDLLEGIYDDWCLYDRERFRLMYLNTLSKLLGFHERNGTYERGLDCAMRILARDPTRERVHRQVMRLYWLSGNQHEAIAQYKLCAQILRQEFGIPPMAKTRLLHQQMVRNQYDPTDSCLRDQAAIPRANSPDDALRTIAERALERLQHLQAMTEETGTELTHIQRLIRMALIDSRQA
jgi:DNA-binding SARP family transcriptional activator